MKSHVSLKITKKALKKKGALKKKQTETLTVIDESAPVPAPGKETLTVIDESAPVPAPGQGSHGRTQNAAHVRAYENQKKAPNMSKFSSKSGSSGIRTKNAAPVCAYSNQSKLCGKSGSLGRTQNAAPVRAYENQKKAPNRSKFSSKSGSSGIRTQNATPVRAYSNQSKLCGKSGSISFSAYANQRQAQSNNESKSSNPSNDSIINSAQRGAVALKTDVVDERHTVSRSTLKKRNRVESTMSLTPSQKQKFGKRKGKKKKKYDH